MKLSSYALLTFTQILCGTYIVIVTFATMPMGLVNPATGVIDLVPRDTIRAATAWQMVCLACSRISAYSMYPLVVLVFLSKCIMLNSFLQRSCFSMFLRNDYHRLHVHAGMFIAVNSLVHTIFHFARWASQQELVLIVVTRPGVTGLE